MLKEDILLRIKEGGIVAVIRGESAKQAEETADICIACGIRAIELTFTVPFAHYAIENLSRKYASRIILGAGTVLDSETARIAILSGADFIVSPHFSPQVVRLCNRYRKLVMSGIMTVTEGIEAMEAGADVLKLFPGELFGPAFIRSLRGPLPYAQVMPTGGVDVSNAGEWIKAGALAVGVGSNLTKGNVAQNAEAFMEQIKAVREGL